MKFSFWWHNNDDDDELDCVKERWNFCSTSAQIIVGETPPYLRARRVKIDLQSIKQFIMIYFFFVQSWRHMLLVSDTRKYFELSVGVERLLLSVVRVFIVDISRNAEKKPSNIFVYSIDHWTFPPNNNSSGKSSSGRKRGVKRVKKKSARSSQMFFACAHNTHGLCLCRKIKTIVNDLCSLW